MEATLEEVSNGEGVTILETESETELFAKISQS